MRRREFLRAAGAAAMVTRAFAANDKITLAIMGVRSRGRALANEFAALPDTNIAYLCDVDSNVFAPAVRIIEERKGATPRLIGDIRRALDDKSVDAIVIATPDHWHAPAMLLACAAGKDVYVEKPVSHNLREGKLMVEAARKHQRVVQTGTQSRSRPSTQRAIEYARSGKIGKILMAKAWDVQLRDNIGYKGDYPPPAGVDYDDWIGPAPALPFNGNRFHYTWHWNWNYGTGDIGNDGIHQIDIARWGLGVDYPGDITGMGRKLCFNDDQQTPDTMNITFTYGNRVLLFEMRIWNPYGMEGMENGVALYGTNGMMHIGRWNGKWGYRVFDDKNNLVLEEYGDREQHARNFLECVRTRRKPNADIETGYISAIHAHLGNIVCRTGHHLKFDAGRQTIVDDAEAGALLGRHYRKHWATPTELYT